MNNKQNIAAFRLHTYHLIGLNKPGDFVVINEYMHDFKLYKEELNAIITFGFLNYTCSDGFTVVIKPADSEVVSFIKQKLQNL